MATPEVSIGHASASYQIARDDVDYMMDIFSIVEAQGHRQVRRIPHQACSPRVFVGMPNEVHVGSV